MTDMLRASRVFAVILTGFTAMSAQIVYMRELLTVFYGNECAIGIVLAAWLIGGAGGSLIGRYSAARSGPAIFALCQALTGALAPITLYAIRMIRPLLGLVPGQAMAPGLMIGASALVLIPLSLVLGFTFAVACGFQRPGRDGASAQVGTVYVLEAAGATAGGLVASFFLVRFLNPFQITGILALLNGSGAFLTRFFAVPAKTLAERIRGATTSRASFLTLVAGDTVFTLALLISLIGGWGTLNRLSLERSWQGYELLASDNSIYGNVTVARRDGQVSFFDNGLHLYTAPDPLPAEEAVHFPLLEHPDPQRILLIGGGGGEMIAEIMKHPVASVDYAELDPLIGTAARLYLPEPYRSIFGDPRVRTLYTDGRRHVMTATGPYDCIIIAVGDPMTAQVNRYYTREFFEKARAILADDGILSFRASSSENYIAPELGAYLATLAATCRSVFADVRVIPGDQAYFIASPKPGSLTYDRTVLMGRARTRGVEAKLRYVRDYYLFSKLAPERVAAIERAIAPSPGEEINTDFRPIAYYRATVFWASYAAGPLGRAILEGASPERLRFVMLLAAFLFFLAGTFGRRGRCAERAVLAGLAATGWTTIAIQIIVALAFQAIYGYLFYQIGLILTFFMAGLAWGAWAAVRIPADPGRDQSRFFGLQAFMGLYAAIIPVVLEAIAAGERSALEATGLHSIFPLISIVAGFAGGAQFPLAGRILLASRPSGGASAGGLSYAVDLAGSCIGAILTGLFMIPVLGIARTGAALALFHAAVITAYILTCRRTNQEEH